MAQIKPWEKAPGIALKSVEISTKTILSLFDYRLCL